MVESWSIFLENDEGVFESPELCPHCGFNIKARREERKHQREIEIENNPYHQLCYDVIGAYEAGVKLHPQEQMQSLGYTLIDSIPQSITDCWWFTVDKYIEPLPSYLSKIKYTIGEP